jgi:hypothetical protein
MFLGSRARPERKADKRIAIYEPIASTMWDPNILQTYGLLRVRFTFYETKVVYVQ